MHSEAPGVELMDNNPNLENLLQMARTAVREGNKEGAKMLLQQVLEADKKNDRAWLLMAQAARNSNERQQYLETALKYNPHNEVARKALNKMTAKSSNRDQRLIVMGAVFLFGVGVIGALCVLAALLIG